MDKSTLEDFRRGLESRLIGLLTGQYGPVSRLADESRGDPMDEADMASRYCDRDILNTIRYRNHLLIREIHSAIQRIRDGEFGICSECSDLIGLERLRAQPTTLLCIRCKRSQETARRLDAA
ncbi:MAG: TraR/DksA family transcriptional regulator [Syntrophobacteraceae bacterium]